VLSSQPGLNRSNIQVRAWYALFHLCWTVGDEAAAIEQARQAAEIDPLAAYPLAMAAYVQASFQRYEDTLVSAKAAVARDPNTYIGQRVLALGLRWVGDHQNAIAAAERAMQLSGGHSWAVMEHANALVSAGRTDEGGEAMESFLAHPGERVVPWIFVAVIHAHMDRMDMAYEALERAFETNDPLLIALRNWPDFHPLREDPRFAEVVQRLGFP